MMYALPTSLEVRGTEYEIRSDYRAALDICAALSDPELDNQEKALAALIILNSKICRRSTMKKHSNSVIGTSMAETMKRRIKNPPG